MHCSQDMARCTWLWLLPPTSAHWWTREWFDSIKLIGEVLLPEGRRCGVTGGQAMGRGWEQWIFYQPGRCQHMPAYVWRVHDWSVQACPEVSK